MKRQKWLTGILAVMLVASFLLVVGAFAPVIAFASGGGGGGIDPDEICSNFFCDWTGQYCEWQGHQGYEEICFYIPYPEMCPRCPPPCEWTQYHWW